MSDAAERALALLDEPAMLAFLRDLVRAPSVFLPGVPGANEQRVARLVYELLEAWGWRPLWQEVAPERPNVVAELAGSQGADGRLLLLEDGIAKRDYRLVQGCVLVISLTYIIANSLTDLVYRRLDPRIRLS